MTGSNLLVRTFVLFVTIITACGLACVAEESARGELAATNLVAPEATMASTSEVAPVKTIEPFWNRNNDILFAVAGALSAADFVATRYNLHHGARELDPITRLFSGSTAGLAVNFAGETAGVIGLSYFFHRTGHHKLEKAVSLFDISTSGAAVGWDLSRR